jgi:cold shock CspA family protein
MKFTSIAVACAFVATAALAQTSTGVVTTFDPKGGPGYIKADGGSTLMFIQMDISGYPWRTVKVGDKVKFTVVKGTQGDRATNIELNVASAPPPIPKQAPTLIPNQKGSVTAYDARSQSGTLSGMQGKSLPFSGVPNLKVHDLVTYDLENTGGVEKAVNVKRYTIGAI